MILRLVMLWLLVGAGARADYFNFRGDPGKDNPMDSNEAGSAVGAGFGAVRVPLERGAMKENWKSWVKTDVKAPGAKVELPGGSMGNAVKIIERAGPALDHAGWLSTAAGEVSTGRFSQGLFTAMNGITKVAVTGIASAVGASFGSVGGPAGTVAGGVSAGYASSQAYDAYVGEHFNTIKENLGKREDAAQMRALASDKMDLGSDPEKKLAETHAKYLEFVKARNEKEKAETAEAEKKRATDALAAEKAKQEAEKAKQEAAKKLAEKQAAEAAQRAAKQKAEGEAARARLQQAVADSKWDGTADYACTKFWLFLAAPVEKVSVGRTDPKSDRTEKVTVQMELKIKDEEKKAKEAFLIRGTSFAHEIVREKDWYGSTGRFRITGSFNRDFTKITTLTVSYEVDPIRVRDEGLPELEADKSWSATLTDIPLTSAKGDPDITFSAEMDTRTRKMPAGVSIAQVEHKEAIIQHQYTRLTSADGSKTPTAVIRTTTGPVDLSLPRSNASIEVEIRKRRNDGVK
jgi:hypothetical protein